MGASAVPEPTTVLSGAAADAVAGLLQGAARAMVVVGAGPHAAYLRDDDGAVLALVRSDAVRVPCAVVLAPGTPVPPSLRPGTVARVGRHEVGWPGGRVRVRRW